ncbi:MAG TPA: hypothetical protein VGB90_07175 [Alphaproteobacteria bacterium]
MTRRTNLRHLRRRWPARLALAGFLFVSFAVPLLAGAAAADEVPAGASHTHLPPPVEPAAQHGHDQGATAGPELPADMPSDPGCTLCKSCAFCVVAITVPPPSSIPPHRMAILAPPSAPRATGFSPAPLPEPPRS